MDNKNTFNIFTDGASRGNPGKAGIGIIIYQNNEILEKISGYIGKKTNNEAEYSAVIIALEKIKYLRDKYNKSFKNNTIINIFSDSQLLVKQLKGEYKIKSKNIIPLINKIKSISKELENLIIKYTWIPRSENSIADSLANKGIDEMNKIDIKINKNENKDKDKNLLNIISNNKSTKNIILEKLFFGKINCFKLQLNSSFEIYFHIGLVNSKTNSWDWIKVKMNDIELGEILNLLNKPEGKISFFHSYDGKKTQIWCNKNPNQFSIKINNISKNFNIGEFEVLKILISESIIKNNFKENS